MYDNIERELKLLINKQVYDNIMNSYDFHKSIIQTNTYFDTKLRICRMAMWLNIST